jgi:hypothetical protein
MISFFPKPFSFCENEDKIFPKKSSFTTLLLLSLTPRQSSLFVLPNLAYLMTERATTVLSLNTRSFDGL